MLRDPRRSASLEIHEEPGVGIYVSGLSEYAVRNAGDCLALVKLGEENRAIRGELAKRASLRMTSILAMNQHPRNGYRHNGYIHYCTNIIPLNSYSFGSLVLH